MKNHILSIGAAFLVAITSTPLFAQEPPTLTAEQRSEVRQRVGQVESQVAQLKAYLPTAHGHLMELWWQPKTVTTQDLADAMGSDAQQLYLLGGALQRFLDLLEPGNEQLLAQFASAPRPTIQANTRQPLADTTWDAEGKATIVPYPTPEPEPEE